jgi:hypothetical protein
VKQNQTITWVGGLPKTSFVGESANLNASASSGLPVSYSVDPPGSATITNGTVTFKQQSTVTITAQQAGNTQWNPAPNIAQTVDVQPKKPDDVIHVSTGQQLQNALANAKDKTVTIQLDGGHTPFNADKADAQGGFESMFTVGNNSNVTLVGNGTLNAKGTTNTVGVHDGSTLTINGDITIKGGKGAYGSGIYNEGTVDLKNGATVQYNHAPVGGEGGGIYNGHEKGSAHPGTLTLEKGSTITDNEAVSGAGIFNDGGTVNLDGGTITFNTTNNDGGTITGNTTNNGDGGAFAGGGIANDGGTVNLNGGSIQNNHAALNGGGIWNGKDAVLYKPDGQELKQIDLGTDGSYRDLVVSNTQGATNIPDNIYLG